ncbi:MAG: energy transducer TonB [Rhodanobacteraceae bacterium]
MLDSSRFPSGFSGYSGALRGLSLAAALTLVLAGCGKAPAPSPTAAVPHAKPAASAPAGVPARATSTANAQTPAAGESSGRLAGMTVSDLLAEARGAYAQHRLVAPAGDNAMEYYEAVLAKDPNNRVASDALREAFPFGVPEVEKAISQNNFSEATREINLLAKADSTNYTLTLLRSKLDAQQKLQARQQQEAQANSQRAEALVAAQRAAAEQAAAQQAAAQQAAATKAAAEQETAERLARQKAAAAKVAAAKAAPPPPPAGETRAAQVVSAATPDYPVEAARNQTSGYAVVQFTVAADGAIEDAHIVQSSPRRVFDSAAVLAIRHSKFEPAMKDGQPVASKLVRRIDFKFGG